MIGTLIGIIVTLIVVGVIWWGVQQLLPLVPLPEPFRKIVNVLLTIVLVLIIVYVILQLLGSVVALPHWVHGGIHDFA